jgi:hypothetical protein
MKPLAVFALAGLLIAVPATVLAQTAPPVGAKVKDGQGKAVGQVEKVILGPDGKPKQVLVRVDRILRTLPLDALTPAGGDYVCVLSRAEIVALPPSD